MSAAFFVRSAQANRKLRREQWRTEGGCSTNSVEDRENGDPGAVAPIQWFWRQL